MNRSTFFTIALATAAVVVSAVALRRAECQSRTDAPVAASGAHPPAATSSSDAGVSATAATTPAAPAGGVAALATAHASPTAAPRFASDVSLRVRELVVARGVRDHAPVDAASTLSLANATRVFAFVRIDNASADTGEVVVTFEHRATGERVGLVSLDVPATHRGYRTWAFTRGIHRTGAWDAVVRTTRGRVLARQAFDVTA